MAKKRELEKVTLNLFHGEFGRLQDLYPQAGAGAIVRALVHKHLEAIDNLANGGTNADTDLRTDGA